MSDIGLSVNCASHCASSLYRPACLGHRHVENVQSQEHCAESCTLSNMITAICIRDSGLLACTYLGHANFPRCSCCWRSSKRLNAGRCESAVQQKLAAGRLQTKHSSARRNFVVRDDSVSGRRTRGEESLQEQIVFDVSNAEDSFEGTGYGNRGFSGSKADLEADVEALVSTEGLVRTDVDSNTCVVFSAYERLLMFISELGNRASIASPNPEQLWLLRETEELGEECSSGRRFLAEGDELSVERNTREEPVALQNEALSYIGKTENGSLWATMDRGSYETEENSEAGNEAVTLQAIGRFFLEAAYKKWWAAFLAYKRLVEVISHYILSDSLMSINSEHVRLCQEGIQSVEEVPHPVDHENVQANLRPISARLDLLREDILSVQPSTVQSISGPRAGHVSLESILIPTGKEAELHGKRLRVAGLQRDFKILEKELSDFVLEHGREGYMPMRRELRWSRRVDLEKAITRMGGFSSIASRLNLSQQRRPRGYWDNFENLCQQIVQFQKESGMDRSLMPTRNALNRGGRADVARALEKWGGLQQVAQLMGLRVRRVRCKTPPSIMSTNTYTIKTEDLILQKPLKISLPSRPIKWVDMMQVKRSAHEGNA